MIMYICTTFLQSHFVRICSVILSPRIGWYDYSSFCKKKQKLSGQEKIREISSLRPRKSTTPPDLPCFAIDLSGLKHVLFESSDSRLKFPRISSMPAGNAFYFFYEFWILVICIPACRQAGV